MTNAIKERNRISLAALELARDKNFLKIPSEERIRLISDVLSIGEEIADWASAEFGTTDPRKLAEFLGVKIFGEDKGNLKKSEYRKKQKERLLMRS